MTVALVIVSHSSLLARGVQEIAGWLAPDVRMVPAGGRDSGELGTSFDLILDALTEASNPDGVAVLADIGSAVIAAHGAVCSQSGGPTAVRLVHAPLVEGTVAAAVAAQGGANLDAVVKIAERVGWGSVRTFDSATSECGTGRVTRQLSLRNEHGLHARPAAALALLTTRFDAEVTVNGTNATSVLELMELGLAPGARIDIEARGPDADAVIESMAAAIADGFGEPLI